MFEDFELITILLNVNILLFSFSYVFVFNRILNSPLDFKNKVRKAEAFIARLIPNKFYKSFYKKEKLIPGAAFTGLLFLLTFTLIFYTYRFYNIAGRFYSGNIFDVIHLCVTAFIFLIIPLFIPSIFDALMYGYFPDDILNYIEGSSSSGIKVKEVITLRKELKNEQWTNKVKFEFWLNLIWIIALIILLDFILTWRFTSIWWIYLILLIICLIVAILVRRIMTNKHLLLDNN
jgi:hypothetical protein